VLGPAVLAPLCWPVLQRASGARLDKDKYVIIRARSPQAIFGLSASPAAISVFGGQNSRGPPDLTIGAAPLCEAQQVRLPRSIRRGGHFRLERIDGHPTRSRSKTCWTLARKASRDDAQTEPSQRERSRRWCVHAGPARQAPGATRPMRLRQGRARPLAHMALKLETGCAVFMGRPVMGRPIFGVIDLLS